MSRNGWEHREDQTAEDQDETKQKNKGENHKYNIDVKWTHWPEDQIHNFQNTIFNVDYRNVH